jgi:hypothetical protein
MTFEPTLNDGLTGAGNDIGRCEAMTIGSDLPPYRCTRQASADRHGRRVCEAHSRTLHRLRFWDDGDDVLRS